MQPSASRIIEERDQLQSKKPDDAKGCCTGGLMVAAKLEKRCNPVQECYRFGRADALSHRPIGQPLPRQAKRTLARLGKAA